MNELSTLSLSKLRKEPSKRESSRSRILDAATELVMKVGFTAVTMTDVADQAKMSRASLYRYYSTKEQLYSDLSIRLGFDLIDRFEENPPTGKTVGERVESVIETVVNVAIERPKLMAAHIATMLSDDQSLQSDQSRLKSVMSHILVNAVGSAKSDNLPLTSSIMRHVLISNLILLNANKTDRASVIHELNQVAAKLLSDIWEQP